MHEFTPATALLGGALIGLAATVLAKFTGHVAGISGIFDGFLRPEPRAWSWRALFILGLLLAAFGLMKFMPTTLVEPIRSLGTLTIAGLLAGFGSRLGSGCTSGHGVCGISRLSLRSLLATMTFVATGMITATCVRIWGGP